MTPDKLPEEITDQIKQAAQNMLVFAPDNKYSYIAGATAWAPWKVKHDELQATIDDKIDKALHAERNKMQAKMTSMEIGYLKQIQRMADALEQCSNIASWMDDPYRNKIIEIVSKALQQLKDGKGKEVENVE